MAAGDAIGAQFLVRTWVIVTQWRRVAPGQVLLTGTGAAAAAAMPVAFGQQVASGETRD
jgi:hypothetical protein